MKRLALTGILVVALGGCTFARDEVMYRHPMTQDEQVCLRPPAIALGPADIPERLRYNECKTKWEDSGYVRAGDPR